MKYIVLLLTLLLAVPLWAQYNIHYTAAELDTAIGRSLRFLEPTYVRVDSATWATRYWTGITYLKNADSTSMRNYSNSLYAGFASPIFTGTPKISSDTIATKAYARSVGGGTGGGNYSSGAAPPDDGNGSDGDTYWDSRTAEVGGQIYYIKLGGTWTQK